MSLVEELRQTGQEGREVGAPRPADVWALEEGDEIAAGVSAVRLLGGGERYETYLAWDEHLFSLVVVKLVRPSLVEDPHSLRGLAKEAELLERLRHPAIVRGLGAELVGPRPYVALEHLEGPRLSSLIRRQGRLEPDQLFTLGLQLASAVHYLGREGIVHLDIKPANVIMDSTAQLIDLSVARTVESLQTVDYPIGTDAYMAPEQSDPVRLGPSGRGADVWGVGATLYHAAAGRRPFEEGAREGTLEERFPQLVQEPDPLGAGIPIELAELILSCLEPDPAARPTPTELASRFEELVASIHRRPVLGRFRIRPRRQDPLGLG